MLWPIRDYGDLLGPVGVPRLLWNLGEPQAAPEARAERGFESLQRGQDRLQLLLASYSDIDTYICLLFILVLLYVHNCLFICFQLSVHTYCSWHHLCRTAGTLKSLELLEGSTAFMRERQM